MGRLIERRIEKLEIKAGTDKYPRENWTVEFVKRIAGKLEVVSTMVIKPLIKGLIN